MSGKQIIIEAIFKLIVYTIFFFGSYLILVYFGMIADWTADFGKAILLYF